jgi:hypothetical protein
VRIDITTYYTDIKSTSTQELLNFPEDLSPHTNCCWFCVEMEDRQTTQWPTENGQKDKQQSTKH